MRQKIEEIVVFYFFVYKPLTGTYNDPRAKLQGYLGSGGRIGTLKHRFLSVSPYTLC